MSGQRLQGSGQAHQDIWTSQDNHIRCEGGRGEERGGRVGEGGREGGGGREGSEGKEEGRGVKGRRKGGE